MNRKQFSLLLLLLLTFTASNLTPKVLATENTLVSMTPEYTGTSVYQSFTVNITILNVTDLSSWQLKLSFNSHIINCTEVIIPDDNIFSGHGTTGLGLEIDNAAGSIKAFNGLWELIGVDGSGKLCSVTFQTLSPGISAFSFNDIMRTNGTYLTDSQNNLIPFESSDGIIQVDDGSFNTYTFNVTQDEIPYNITIFSNSTITNFNFNYTLQQISFHASGTPSTAGSCTISIPKPLLNGTFAILVDDYATYHSKSVDASDQYLCFNYQHTTAEHQHIQIITTIVGDINGDRKVDMRDIAITARAFGTIPGDDRWDPRADVNNDLKADMKDIAIVARNYGKLWTP